jgi:hypothetical protein
MAQGLPVPPRPPGPAVAAGAPSGLRLEVRLGPGRTSLHEVPEAGFLIGSVAGCDLRLPGVDLPPVICLIAHTPHGPGLRKLSPTYAVLVNGRAFSGGPLAHGDRLTFGAVELQVQVTGPALVGETDPPRPAVARAEQPDGGARSEVEAQARKLAADREQLYQQYRERSDRLAALKEAVDHAARKVQEQKRQLEVEKREAAAQKAELGALAANLEVRTRAFEDERRRLQEQEKAAAERLADCEAREQECADRLAALEQRQAQHQADLVALHRLQAALDERERQVQARGAQVDEQFASLQRTGAELEEQARQFDAWQARLQEEAAQLERRKAEHASVGTELQQRSAAFEGQQAMLAALRTRLERMREELRRDEELLTEQRRRLEAAETELQRRAQETERLRAELDQENQSREEDRRRFAERSAVMEQAVARLRQVQETLDAEQTRLEERVLAVNTAANEQAEEASLLQARSAQVLEMQQRLQADRQALRERETALAQAEQVRGALQEQLRRRSDELTARQRALAEQARLQEEQRAALEQCRVEVEHERHQSGERLAAVQQELQTRAAELDRLREELTQREETLARQAERLKETGRAVAADRKALHEARLAWEVTQLTAAEAATRERAELDAARQAVGARQRQLPELELRAQAAGDRVARAREQLREHLAEVHAYARQSHADLDQLREQVRAEGEQVRQRELALHRARDEHRLAVAAFRQQLIDWQAQVAEMKRSLAQNETRLELRQARVEEQQRHNEEASQRLAQQAEQLEEQQRAVAEQRSEMERHLADLREWYRRKLRELAFGRLREPDAATESPGPARALLPAPSGEERPGILSLTGDVEPGDRKLGDLLRSLELIDAETLTALLVEARKQRRSLRQALLGGGFLTLYQMALIEAGNLDGLVLGRLRVIDRLKVTPHEAVYRVYDPHAGRELVLRHLAETELEDAVHPDEYRQRFTQAAAVQHPHVAATLEVLEIGGRPAVLQEWLSGLASSDWPPLAAAPGVWFRLVSQAALALHAAHEAGLTHGHLQSGSFVLNEDGAVKLCGLGEPPWLVQALIAEPAGDDVTADLAALGRVVGEWAALHGQLKPGKTKPPPAPLRTVLDRLAATDGYATTADLLADLEQAGAQVPANTQAWERLRRHVREHAMPGVALRQSA